MNDRPPDREPQGALALVISRGPTKTVRFPAGSDLADWYEQHADATGVSANALMVLVLDRFRAETTAATEQESKRDEHRTPDAGQT